MNVPRPSHGAEAAALQAEFNEKKWVWVPDEKEGYLAGWVNQENEDVAEVIMSTGGEVGPYTSIDTGLLADTGTSDTTCTIICFVENEPTQV